MSLAPPLICGQACCRLCAAPQAARGAPIEDMVLLVTLMNEKVTEERVQILEYHQIGERGSR